MDEKDIVISVKNLTKDYGKGRGIFDVSFDVPRGCVFGYCGTNGSGKTTTLRHIMGFIKPDSGSVTVNGLDSLKDSDEIKKFIGYLPGEIAFPAVANGSEFLKIQAEMINMTDFTKAERLINSFQLDPTANVKRMSKGMKQKTALVAAFMHSPDIIILDEPTTGLDPLMREVFVNLIKEEKARGATIIMSNHMFDELEETCDKVAFIKNGRIVDIVDLNEMHNRPYREFIIEFGNVDDYKKVKEQSAQFVLKTDDAHLTLNIKVDLSKANAAAEYLSTVEIKSFKEKQYTLETYFMEEIGGKEDGANN